MELLFRLLLLELSTLAGRLLDVERESSGPHLLVFLVPTSLSLTYLNLSPL